MFDTCNVTQEVQYCLGTPHLLRHATHSHYMFNFSFFSMWLYWSLRFPDRLGRERDVDSPFWLFMFMFMLLVL